MNSKRLEVELDQKLLIYSKCLSSPSNSNEQQLQVEIESLLQQLQELGHANLQDYKQEYKRLKHNIQQAHSKQLLLQVPTSSSSSSNSSNLLKQMEQREQLIDINRLNDQIINNAQDVRQELQSQRQSFSNSNSSLSQLLFNSFPQISSTMVHIWRRKRRDLIILSLVIAICLFITFYLLF